jgi:hypothetical protein
MRITRKLRTTARRHPGRWAAAGVVAAAVVAFALYWFAPWNLFVDRRVDEAPPGAIAPGAGWSATPGATGETPHPAAEDGADDDGEPPAGDGDEDGPGTLAAGRFRGLEHDTAGAALVLELEDGSRILRLEDLETSNGPDLRVVLTDRPLSDDWHVWDDGELVDLGPLKGNLGSSNYEIPDRLDLSGLRTAVIWCRRFSVGFGVAPLLPAQE